MAKGIIWTRTADFQLAGILKYWVQRKKSISFSKKLLALVAQRTSPIAENPLLFKPPIVESIRTAPMGDFSIFYRFTQEQITVVAFWDNRQDPEKLLNILQGK